MTKKIKKKKSGTRPKTLDLATYLDRSGVKAVTTMALQEILIQDQMLTANEEQARVLNGMINNLNQLNKLYIGAVEAHMIEFSDRYLCRVQEAMDGFFDEMTDHHREQMVNIKEKWTTAVGDNPLEEVTE